MRNPGGIAQYTASGGSAEQSSHHQSRLEGAEWDVVQGMHGLLAAADERVEIVIEISAAAAHDEEP
jgi:hypothetical protein